MVFKHNDRFRSGLPDLQILTPTRTIFMEIKTEEGVVTPIQHQTLKRINQTVAEGYVVRSLKQAKQIMKGGDSSGSGKTTA